MVKELFRRLRPYGQMPQTLLIGGFSGVILVGTLLLLLPWSQNKGEVGFIDALFTSTSAVCVTGLIVVDTATAYTAFGQVVIAALIQIGGLGIMTFAALAYLMLGRRLSLASQAALHDAFFHAISAFCNAGFSIYKDNLVGFRDSPVILTTVMALIVPGGLGHMVLSELLHYGKGHLTGSVPAGSVSLSTHTRGGLATTRHHPPA
jgi:trk system potassium uptake protein